MFIHAQYDDQFKFLRATKHLSFADAEKAMMARGANNDRIITEDGDVVRRAGKVQDNNTW